jgi:carboxypeptidase Taq
LTRYNRNFFNESFFGILHEAGHGLYEQGLLPEHYGTPMGEAVSLGIHESQSRLWENSVGRSRPFWRHYYPKARGIFRDALGSLPMEDFYFAVNKVAPSFIRVEADEVTYNLHILIRFELERALISEDLSVDALPAAWNDKYQKYLGILPPDDALGCLQDVHWSAGLIGYFPTYTLGNIYGAQFFNQANTDLGGLDARIAAGEFEGLLGWLREKIHRHGKRYQPVDLVREVVGADPSPEPLVRQLHAKFDELYGL